MRRRERLNVGGWRRGLIFVMQNSIQEGTRGRGERNKIFFSPSEYNEWPLLLENSSTKPENIFKFVRVRERERKREEEEIFLDSALAGELSSTTIVLVLICRQVTENC